METSVVTLNVHRIPNNRYKIVGVVPNPAHASAHKKVYSSDTITLGRPIGYQPKHLAPSKKKSKIPTGVIALPLIAAAIFGASTPRDAQEIRAQAPKAPEKPSHVSQIEGGIAPSAAVDIDDIISNASKENFEKAGYKEDIEEFFEEASSIQGEFKKEPSYIAPIEIAAEPQPQEIYEADEEIIDDAEDAADDENGFEIILDNNMQYSVDKFVERYNKNIDRYKYVEYQTGIASELVAAIHCREGSNNFSTCLHNGAPLGEEVDGKIYYSWEESAVDAINKIKKMYTPVYGDIETYYKFAEQYNGTGYSVYHDMNSPYVWSGTDKYDRGMYTSDGSFNPDYKDTRPGVAVLLDALGLS